MVDFHTSKNICKAGLSKNEPRPAIRGPRRLRPPSVRPPRRRVRHVQRLGLGPFLVGCLDEHMARLCARRGVPAIMLDGRSILPDPGSYFSTGAAPPARGQLAAPARKQQ